MMKLPPAKSDYLLPKYFSIFFFGTFTTALFIYLNHVQPYYFIDEAFHIPQTLQYCHGNFTYWDPKITTLPGLYVVTAFVLSPFNLCSTIYIRCVNLFGTFLNLYLSYAIISEKCKNEKTLKWDDLTKLAVAYNITLFPPLFFWHFLYYTDVMSVNMVLLMYLLHLRKNIKMAAVAGLFATFVRQTNIIWLPYLMVEHLLDLFDREIQKPIPSKFYSSLTYLKFLWNHIMEQLHHGWLFFVKFILSICINLLPYALVILTFIAFVVWNKGIVVGDRAAHVPTIHIPQLLYFSAFASCFLWPYLIAYWKAALTCVKSHWVLLDHLSKNPNVTGRIARVNDTPITSDGHDKHFGRDVQSGTKKMVSKLPQEFRRYHRNRIQLRHILKETRRALEVINLENFFPGENIVEELLSPVSLDRITHILNNSPAIVVFGQDNKAKASLVNGLLSADILPVQNGSWRWIKFTHGHTNHVSLTLALEYEVVERLQANEKLWNTLPIEDLTKSESEDTNCPTVLEVKLDQPVLKDGVQIFIVPNNGAVKILAKGSLHILPIFLYALGDQPLTEQNLEELKDLKETYPYNPVLFISSLANISLDSIDAELTESEQHRLQSRLNLNDSASSKNDDGIDFDKMNSLGLTWLDQLTSLGFLGIEDSVEVDQLTWLVNGQYVNGSDLVDSCKKLDRILYFTCSCLQSYLINASTYLNEIHTTSLRKFILSAFDMARKIQITPRRIQYAQQKENELYASLMKIVNEKQEELTELIQNIIQEMKDDVISSTNDLYRPQSVFSDDIERAEWSATHQAATSEVQKFVLGRLGEKVAKELVNSVNCLQETFVGTLQRCLLSLEKSYEHDSCLLASDALKQILSTAYNVELHNSSPSLVHSFLERIRQFFKSLPLSWAPTPTFDASWRKKVTVDILHSLSAARLARTISMQFKEKLKSSHDAFQAALRSLENYYSGKLERTEEQRVAIRKFHAPRLAKLALESTSMMDAVRYGIPPYGKEIGRGQYGVVFACDGWGGAPGPCAVKSVVPPDERHWNDLAMEFYYTRSIPDHKRIVKLRGSVIDQSYGGGFGLGAAVLLITDRLSRDLYCGIRAGLSWLERIQIAIDVLEGIRYLHSQGLVHRDIKLKNVLLDTENRAKLTDLGFCITEAMMSGSIVGTPIHMAPELMSGHYDSSVDVYAFGILFWYICAGQVRLPYAFEQFHNKEQLWTSVRKGIRPERLPHFDEECWRLMEQCWSGEPSKRPLLGAILPVLESIQRKAERGKSLQQLNALKLQESSAYELKNPALALAEPYNQRGAITSPLPAKRRALRAVKYPVFHMTNIFQTSVCSNLYVQMREF
ncbi:hypothetical protein KM043_008479 [Ampulex compressa]|nr:hypothetical protein KM043_008479 [Ampulex compressa]